jgi:GNAT superfamily N-acetyltransferase
MPSELSEILARAATGCPPPPDGGVTVLPQPSPRDAGVISFTAHSVVFADVPPGWVHATLPDDDPGAPLSPQFLLALAGRLGRRTIGSIDMLTVAQAQPGPPPVPLEEVTASDHPRVARARRYRDELRIWTGGGATVTIGRGVARRYEVAVEVDPDRRGKGVGRAALLAARHLVPPGEPLWAQIAPGNAASVRTFLAAGFTPTAAEALLTP